MFCTDCGAPNPEGSVFCKQCGSKLYVETAKSPVAGKVVHADPNRVVNNGTSSNTDSATTTTDTSATGTTSTTGSSYYDNLRREIEQERANKASTFNNSYNGTGNKLSTRRLKYHTGTNLFASTLNELALYMVLSIIAIFNGSNAISSLLNSVVGDLGPFGLDSIFEPASFLVFLGSLFGLVPIVLITLGMGILYGSGRECLKGEMDTRGVTLIKVGVIIDIIKIAVTSAIIEISLIALLVKIFGIMEEYNSYESRLDNGIVATIVIVLIVVAVVNCFILTYLSKINALLEDSCYSTMNDYQRRGSANYVAVISIIVGIAYIISGSIEFVQALVESGEDEFFTGLMSGRLFPVLFNAVIAVSLSTIYINLGKIFFRYKDDVPEET